MSVDDYPFRHSRPVEASELPDGYFHIIPCRLISPPLDSSIIDRAKDDWSRAVGKELPVSILNEKDFSSSPHVYPECPPSKRGLMLGFVTIATLWNDEMGTLRTDEHQAIVDDLALAIMSRVKTGTSIACDYKTNDIYYSALTGILPQLGCRDDEQNTVLKEFLAILRSQPMPSLNQITFDAYKEHKSKSNAGMFAKLVIPICHDLHISESEQASVASLIKLGSLITGLANDYESFYRDFEEHATSGSLDVIPNAMAVLMANYDYTEEEANNILRREILSLERQFLTNYDDWKASPAFKSADLRAYMALWVTSVGGTCYAQAISPRYHGLKLKTTAEDRAQLVCRNKRNYRLHGYPPPASFKQASETLRKDSTNSSAGGQGDILAPFKKASAEQLCMAPYEYTRSTPGK